jgi:two-component system response regulator
MIEDYVVEILLVEDNPSDLELALHALHEHHISNRIEVARDGAEALEFMFSPDRQGSGGVLRGPKVVLLDLKLPKVDGIEVLRRLRADPRTRHVPVVVLTSSAEERDIVDAYNLGVNSYIVKPVDFQQFSEAVRQLGLYWLMLNQPPAASEPPQTT